MRTFVYFSSTAKTSGNFPVDRLMDAGRMDIAIHVVINTFFLSHSLRDDTVLHLVFYGAPDPPKHIEIQVNQETGLSKKDVAGLIKKILYKYKPGKKTEVVPGCFIEKKSFLDVVEEISKEGKEIFILDKKGKNIRETKIGENSAFILGDQNGLPKKELKRLKKTSKVISVGPKVYFASQVVSILNNEMDLRGF
ncbi:MAG: tRNA (pseudouridine(54)-N(1))-methyltransferase TrmY, partial [Nanoarchaeota archaeon]